MSHHSVGKDNLDKRMNGIGYILEALEIAEKNQPRYNFLIYNASLVLWNVARPLLKEDSCKKCVDCFIKMCDLLEKLNFEDKCWRAKYQMALFTAYLANGTKDKALNCVKTGITLVQNEQSDEAKYIMKQLNYLASIYGGGKGGGAIITSPRDQLYYDIIALKQTPIGDQKIESTLIDYMGKIYPDSIDIYNQIIEKKESESPVKTPQANKKGGKKTPSVKVQKKAPTKVAKKESIPSNEKIKIDPELLVELGEIAINQKLQEIAETCMELIKQVKDADAHTNLLIDYYTVKYMVFDIDNIKGANKLDERRILAIKLNKRCDAIKKLCITLQSCRRLNDPALLQRLSILGWNICLPLLQPNLRRHVYQLFSIVNDSLQDIDSLYYLLRSQLHLELAKFEIDNDLLTKAKYNVNEGIKIDYGLIEVPIEADDTVEEIQNKLRKLDRVLLPLKRKLDLKTDLYRDFNSPIEKVVLLIEQTKAAKQINVKIHFIEEAINILEEIEREEKENEEKNKAENPEQQEQKEEKSKDAEEYRTILYSEISELAWNLRHLEFTKKCCSKVLKNEWNTFKYKNIIMLQCETYLRLVECLVKEGKEICDNQNINSPENLIGYYDENIPKDLTDFRNEIIGNLIKTMKLGESINEKWICENAAIYFWNYHLPYFQSNVFDKSSDTLVQGVTDMIDLLERIKSEDKSLLLSLYWCLLKMKEAKVYYNILLESI